MPFAMFRADSGKLTVEASADTSASDVPAEKLTKRGPFRGSRTVQVCGSSADTEQVEAAENIWRPLGELLVSKGLVTQDELELALTEQADTGRLLGAILVERGYVSGPALAVALAEQYGVELKTERGFGTGLWAEIDRRHRQGRGQDGEEEDDEDNVVQLEPIKLPALEVVPDQDSQLELLKVENRRLQDEIERLRGEFSRLKLVEAPDTPSSHLLFVPTPARYLLLERDGAPPQPGEELELPDTGRLVVAKVGRAPFPGERRPCAFLLSLD
jgi:hypothetical protein